MTLSTLEKLVLRVVAQDGDYERLDLVLSELKEHLPGSSDEKALETSQLTLQSLISKGLVELYRRKRTETAEYTPLPRGEYERTLEQRNCWFWDEKEMADIGAAPTTEGQRVYESECNITQ